MLSTDILYIFAWWIIFFVIGVVNLPLTSLLFGKFYDKGYALSKIIGIAILSYLFLCLSVIKILPLTVISLLFLLFFIAGINYWLILRKKVKYKYFQKILPLIALEEFLFLGGLLLWSYIRGFFPDINGLEKFMDYGFINSILSDRYLPPMDMWFAGEPINYYWFGHLVTAILTKLSSIPPSVTYNLMIASIFGLGLSTVFSVVFNLVQKIQKSKKSIKKAIFAGLLSAFLVNLAGNFHTPYYVYKNGRDKYWYPDATRFIGYNPDTNDKTIHEFPLYSYVVSDLHAHLLNLPFVILYIALLYSYLLDLKGEKISKTQISQNLKLFRISTPLGASDSSFFRFRISQYKYLIFLGFVLGIMFMTSTWDFGNYLILTGAALGLYHLIKNGFTPEFFLNVILKLGSIFMLSLLFAVPFLVNFKSIAEGIDFTNSQTPIWQLLVLWGFPLFLTILFLTMIFKKYLNNSPGTVKTPDIFVGSLLITAWALIFLPEFIYVKDIYIASHHRANTMFKLTYQAFVISYLAGGYIVFRFLNSFKYLFIKLTFSLLVTTVLASVFIYPKIAIYSYYRDLKDYQGLDGEIWLKKQNPDAYVVILWIRQNVKQKSVVLEAPGDSYTEYNVISSYTGMPTVSGWFVHEWLWRGDSTFPQKRVEDITSIYTSSDINLTKNYLSKYNVKYVIIGPNEQEKFPNLNEAKFTQLGTVVFTTPTVKIYKIN